MLRAAEFYFDGKIDTGCRAAAMTPGCDPSGIQDSWTFVFANCSATGLKALCPMATAIINSTSDFTAPCSSCPRRAVACRCSSMHDSWQSCCVAVRVRRVGKIFAVRSSRLDS